MEEKEKVLEVKNLRVSFKTDDGKVQAVRGVSFDLYKGETLCIVGESGSGKSVSSKAIMGILSANAIIENGSIIYKGEDLLKVSEEEFHRIRGHKIGMIFQDPLSSLNPIVRIGKQLIETMMINNDLLKRKYNDLISEDLVNYLNAGVHRDQRIKDVVNKRDFELRNVDVEIKKVNKDIEKLKEVDKNADVKALEEKIKSFEAEKKQITKDYKVKIAEETKLAKAEYKEVAPELKAKLNAKKKEAKQEIKEYKAQLKSEFEEKQNALKAKLESASEEEKKEIEAQLKANKEEYVNSIKITRSEAKKRAIEVMTEVGIPQAEKRFRQYPFEFSGGMRQRIVIAIALIANPEILICDEPTTALDVTIQAQILELINKLKRERNLSCIFITHDLGVVANMADRVAVMYAGKIVEYGTAYEIFYNPKHPYTWALLSSIPDIDSKEKLEAIPGTPPNMIYPPVGDAFALRSKYALAIDFKYEPPYFKVSDTHYAATWLLHEDAPKVSMPKIVSTRIKKALKEAEAHEQK